jgi:antitoxin (DNA-binding transcriptional repressor) of toxin-antitoxin stability system
MTNEECGASATVADSVPAALHPLPGDALSDRISSDMKTTLRDFQRRFAAIRARADAGETVEIESAGAPRYVFKLLQPAEREPLSRLLARATHSLDVRRDKRPMRRA